MTITWLPPYEEIVHRLKVLDRAEDALQECGIGGIYDDFEGLADAIEQMAHYVKGTEEIECERDKWRMDWESMCAMLVNARTELARAIIQRNLARQGRDEWKARAESATGMLELAAGLIAEGRSDG